MLNEQSKRLKKRCSTRIVLVLSLAFSSCARTGLQGSDLYLLRSTDELKVNIPRATWVPTFFKSIDRRGEQADLEVLKSQNLPGGDLEIRVWSGFGVSALQGFVLRRQGDHWSAYHIPPVISSDPNSRYAIPVVPKSGWPQLWERLTKNDILTLPDSSTLPDEDDGILDGISYVVEINMNHEYRTYMYANPQYQNFPEAKRMVNIADTLFDELLSETGGARDQ